MIRPAMIRGTTRYATGSYASVSRASICSVTRMVPISAVICAPTRPARTSPVSSGPSSRITICRAINPTTESWIPAKSWYRVWSAMTLPMKAATRDANGNESTPIARICLRVSGRYVLGSASARRISRAKYPRLPTPSKTPRIAVAARSHAVVRILVRCGGSVASPRAPPGSADEVTCGRESADTRPQS